MLVCDIPCDECGDVTMPKFCGLVWRQWGETFLIKLAIFCPPHNGERTDTELMREGAD